MQIGEFTGLTFSYKNNLKGYVMAMWLSENNGHPPPPRSIRAKYSQWPLHETRLLCSISELIYPFFFLRGTILVDSIFINDFFFRFYQISQNLNNNVIAGDRISDEVPLPHWQYPASRTGSHTEAALLTSDSLYFTCFVFQSNKSTLNTINTVICGIQAHLNVPH